MSSVLLLLSNSVQNPGRVASVLYTLDLVAGNGHQPTNLSDSPH